jgi:hypothetical protein
MSAGGMGGQQGQPMGGGGKGGMGQPVGGGKGGPMNRGPGGNAQNNPGGHYGGPRPFGPGMFQMQASSNMPMGRPMPMDMQGASGMTPIQGLTNYGQSTPMQQSWQRPSIAAPTPQQPKPMSGLLSQLYGNFGG